MHEVQELVPVAVRLPAPHPKQREILSAWNNPALRFQVIAAGTKFGKTFIAAEWLLQQALTRENSVNQWIGQTYAASDYARALIKSWLPANLYEEYVALRKLALLTPEGQEWAEIQFKSGDDADKLRGFAVDAAVVDEAARQAEDAWTSISTTVFKTAGRVMLISTPSIKRGWFFERYMKGIKVNDDGSSRFPDGADPAPDWLSIRCSSHANPFITEAAHRSLEADMTPRQYAMEVEGMFLEEDAAAFRNVRECIRGETFEAPIPGEGYVIGADIAHMGRSYTVFVVMKRSTKTVVNMYRLQHQPFDVQKMELVRLAKDYNDAKVCIDATGLGANLAEDLPIAGVNRISFPITSSSKPELIRDLALALERREISYPLDRSGKIPSRTPHAGQLITELELYEVEEAQNRPRYRSERTSDCVIALALAVQVLQQQPIKYVWANRRGI